MDEVLRAERKAELAAAPARVLLVEGQSVHGARQGLRARTDKSAACSGQQCGGGTTIDTQSVATSASEHSWLSVRVWCGCVRVRVV
jgi:hypothetical protein